MRVHAVYLNWRFGVRLKMGKSIRGGDTQPLRGQRGRHSRRRWLSRTKVTFCEAESSYWLSEQSGFCQLYGIVETALWSPLTQRFWNNMVSAHSVHSIAKYEFGVSLSLVRGIRKMTHWFFCSIRNAYTQIMAQTFSAACAAAVFFKSLSRLKFN